MSYAALYVKFIKIKIKSYMEDRSSLVLFTIGNTFYYLVDFLLVWILVKKFNTMSGWNPYDILFLFAFNLLSYSLAAFFLYKPMDALSVSVQNGSFDEILTKPLNSLFYLTFREFNPGYFSYVLMALLIMVICIVKIGLVITPLKLTFLVVTILSAAVIQGAALIITAVPAFWFMESRAISSLFFWNLRSFIAYPLSLYGKVIQVLLTIIIPYGFISFYPSQYFLDKHDYLMFHPVIQYLSPVIAGLMGFGAYKMWQIAINHYSGAGS